MEADSFSMGRIGLRSEAPKHAVSYLNLPGTVTDALGTMLHLSAGRAAGWVGAGLQQHMVLAVQCITQPIIGAQPRIAFGGSQAAQSSAEVQASWCIPVQQGSSQHCWDASLLTRPSLQTPSPAEQ